MAYCPGCNAEWQAPTTDCPICGRELIQQNEQQDWILAGEIEDQLSADFARETLSAYEIPAVIVSRSGFFGTIGLTFTGFYSGRKAMFEVNVPAAYVDEASGVLDMTLGAKWHRKDA